MTDLNLPTLAYEDTLTDEQLRREVRDAWDMKHALLKALRDLPEMPPAFLLAELSVAADWPSDWNDGKRLQSERRDLEIPFKTECEQGAGFWFRLREGLLRSKGGGGVA